MMPSDAFFGMRRDVVEIFKKLHPASLRYPGGCYAEFFHWQHSLLPVDQHPGKKVVYLRLINRSMSRKQNVAFSLPQECSNRSISIRGYEPVELKCDCDKFSSFGYDSDGNTDIITIYPGQIVCCSLELD